MANFRKGQILFDSFATQYPRTVLFIGEEMDDLSGEKGYKVFSFQSRRTYYAWGTCLYETLEEAKRKIEEVKERRFAEEEELARKWAKDIADDVDKGILEELKEKIKKGEL